MRLDMSLIRAKSTTCEVEYVVFTQLFAVDYDVCAKRDAKFEANGKQQVDHAEPPPGSLSRASVKVFHIYKCPLPFTKQVYTWLDSKGGKVSVCSSALPECPEGTVNLAVHEPHVSHRARQRQGMFRLSKNLFFRRVA